MLQLHHLRNATLVIETGDLAILVDPMLGPPRSIMPFTVFRFKPRWNPLVRLPDTWEQLQHKVTHCLITHLHPDHLERTAVEWIKRRRIPVICSGPVAKVLRNRKVENIHTVRYWDKTKLLGGTIEGIPARHGYGVAGALMGHVMGFFISWPGKKSIYIGADTVYTPAVERVLMERRPDISILACGSAQLDLFKPILMTKEDILKFMLRAPGQVVANHLEALNHCPATRQELRVLVEQHGLKTKVFIPEDGELISF